MHELSLATSVLKIVEQEATKHNSTSIKSIEIEIGTLAGVELQTFEFAMNSVIKSSQFNNAQVILNRITAQSLCTECNHQFTPISKHQACPACHSLFTTLLHGSEFRLSAITHNKKEMPMP